MRPAPAVGRSGPGCVAGVKGVRMGEQEQSLWREVDAALEARLLAADPVLAATAEAAERAGLPPIAVSPLQGAFLQVLARAIAARRILEVGTLAGYSTTWLARALPDEGRLVTLERDPRHAAVARANLERAGLAERVELRVGTAAESLAALRAEGAAPFDLVFLDADKANNAHYVRAIWPLCRSGTVIVVDNVVRGGGILDAQSPDPEITGTQEALDLLGRRAGVVASALQTVGRKGYDGFAIAVVEQVPAVPG